MMAARFGHTDVMRLLIDHGAVVDAAVPSGRLEGTTALQFAVRACLLNKRWTVCLRVSVPAFHGVACLVRSVPITLLSPQAEGGHMPAAQLLIEHGADVSLADKSALSGFSCVLSVVFKWLASFPMGSHPNVSSHPSPPLSPRSQVVGRPRVLRATPSTTDWLTIWNRLRSERKAAAAALKPNFNVWLSI